MLRLGLRAPLVARNKRTSSREPLTRLAKDELKKKKVRLVKSLCRKFAIKLEI